MNLKQELTALATELHNAAAAPTATGQINPAIIHGVATKLESLAGEVGLAPAPAIPPAAPPEPVHVTPVAVQQPEPVDPEPPEPPPDVQPEEPEQEEPDEPTTKKKLAGLVAMAA